MRPSGFQTASDPDARPSENIPHIIVQTCFYFKQHDIRRVKTLQSLPFAALAGLGGNACAQTFSGRLKNRVNRR